MVFLRYRLAAERVVFPVLMGILFLAPLSATAQTAVGGIIASDSVWSASADPFVVSQNVVVVSNAILTIEPGVEVRFEADTVLSISNGTLIARGTIADTILFTAHATPPDAGSNRWGYIEFAADAANAAFTPGGTYYEGSILEYAVLRFGGGTSRKGVVRVEESNPFITHTLIESNATGGLYYNDTEVDVRLAVTDNTIRHNESDGNGGGLCLMTCPGVVVADNTICHNGAGGKGGGVYLQECANAVLTNNTICSNESVQGGGAVALWLSPGALLVENTIRDNEGTPGGGVSVLSSRAVRLEGNGLLENTSNGSGGGLVLSSSHSVVLSGNTFVSNRTAAGSMGGAIYTVSGADLWMSGNTVTLNAAGVDASGRGGGGLYALFAGTIYLEEDQFLSNTSAGRGGAMCLVQIGGCDLSGCVVTGNTASAGGGLSVEETAAGSAPDVVLSSDLLNPSRIEGNSLYNVYNGLAYGGTSAPDGSGNIDGRGVWWGTENGSIIAALIYDRANDSSKGFVVYSPFAVPVTPSPAIIESFGVSQNQFELSFTNVVDGNVCTVERSLDLSSGGWDAFTNIVVGSLPVVFSWTEAETNQAAFYRILATDWGLAW